MIKTLDVDMSGILLQELLEFLNAYLKIDEFKDYCPNGLQIRGKNQVQKIACSTSASLEIIQQACHNKVDALIVHHGLFWDKDSRVLDGPILEKIKLLLDHDVSLIAYHLPLDAHKEVGNNFPLLKHLGARDVEGFEHVGAKGVIDIKKEDLIQKVAVFFDKAPIVPHIDKQLIQSIAVVSGGAHASIKACKTFGIDAFITGTCDEWVWDFSQENNLLFIPVGHYKSETLGIKLLAEFLKKTMGFDTIYLESQNLY